jgi:[pyruvate, water dikinase]-phosphate phosphotransferase / [pyruvate, water dikinase] kinase
MYDCTIFFISDGTGITAEAFGHAILAQFEINARHVRLPFIDTIDKARQAMHQVSEALVTDGRRPIVFSTLVHQEIRELVTTQCQGLLFNLFESFIERLEKEFQCTSNHRIGRFNDVSNSKNYLSRVEAIQYSLEHDDGQTNYNLEQAEVILIGISRSGKTPTSLYMAIQYGIRVANYPLIPEDFERQQLPPALQKFRDKMFGLSILPERLSEIRNERKPESHYASLENCRYEVHEAESMMRRSGIRWLSTTNKSIEEIAAVILQEVRPDRMTY